MSSPAESAGYGQKVAETAPKTSMPVDILFCPECSNMLYPKEDKDAQKLMYQCRTCQHVQQATSNCVYRNILKSQAGDTAGVTQDVALDPTVGAASPTSALAMCGCCGQVIMCSDCEIRPAVVDSAAADDNDDNAEFRRSHGSPPQSYVADVVSPMMPLADEQAEWRRILDEVADLNVGSLVMNDDMQDEEMGDWEPEMEGLHSSPGKALVA